MSRMNFKASAITRSGGALHRAATDAREAMSAGSRSRARDASRMMLAWAKSSGVSSSPIPRIALRRPAASAASIPRCRCWNASRAIPRREGGRS